MKLPGALLWQTEELAKPLVITFISLCSAWIPEGLAPNQQ